MITYTCRFFDAAWRAFGSQDMDWPDETAAIARSHVIFANGIGSGYEIWDQEWLVYRERRAHASLFH